MTCSKYHDDVIISLSLIITQNVYYRILIQIVKKCAPAGVWTRSAPFRVGDSIDAGGGLMGKVEKIGLRATHVRLKWDGQMVQVSQHPRGQGAM